MKRYIPLFFCIMLLPLLDLHGQDSSFEGPRGFHSHPSPFSRKYVEFGFRVTGEFANDFIGIQDIFHKQIVLDLNELEQKIGEAGGNFNFNTSGDLFFLTIKRPTWSFGIFSSFEGALSLNMPQSFFTLLSQGNTGQPFLEGDMRVFGGIFADLGLKAQGTFGRLRVGIKPATYSPLIYIPKSTVHYELQSEDSLIVSTSSTIQVYSPVSLETIKLDPQALFKENGIDISLDLAYNLFSFLDLGVDIIHIPIIPAVLKHRMDITSTFDIDGGELIKGNPLNIPDMDKAITKTYTSDEQLRVRRPLRFDFYGLYSPFSSPLLVLRPNIGFTALNPSEEISLNAGLAVQLNLLDLFRLRLGAGYTDDLWKYKLGLALNLRVFEVDIEGGIQSPGFIYPLDIRGLNLGLGLRFGW